MELIFGIVVVIAPILAWVILKLCDLYKNSVTAQISFKITFLSVLVFVFIASGIYLICGVVGVCIEEANNSVESRLDEVNLKFNTGDYYFAREVLVDESCYEAEFEYAWERLLMYEAYNRYEIRRTALEAITEANEDVERMQIMQEEVENCKQELLDLCQNSKEDANKAYVQFFEMKLSE